MVNRCAFSGCKNKILSVGINCHKCKLYFCSNHRLPEEHICPHMQEIKEEAYANLSNTLQQQKCVATKI